MLKKKNGESSARALNRTSELLRGKLTPITVKRERGRGKRGIKESRED